MTKLATQKDVALLAGVSQALVSMVLNGDTNKNNASAEVADRVLKAAKRLNYRSNLSGRSMRHGRFFTIGYLTATATDNCADLDFPAYRAGVFDASSEQSYHVTMIRLPSHLAKDSRAVSKTYREAHLDALIVNPYSASISEIKELLGVGNTVPVVYLNVKEQFNSIYVDDYLGGRLATECLFNEGFRRIAFFTCHSPNHHFDHYSQKDRVEGYASFMAEQGLVAEVKNFVADIFSYDCHSEEERLARSRMYDWLKGPDRPEAVFCYSDVTAMILQQLLYEIGLRVPDDVAIIGYDNLEMGIYSVSPLSSIHIPRYEMGLAAAKMAISLIDNSADGEPYRVPSMKFLPTLIVRSSSRTSKSGVSAVSRKNLS